MIYKYESEKFEKLRALLYSFFGEKLNDANIDNNRKRLLSIFRDILEKNNIKKFTVFDDLNLKFHDYADIDNAINHNLLSDHNIKLLNIEDVNSINRIELNSLIESFYLVIFADFYESSLIIRDYELKKYLDKIITSLEYFASNLSADNLKTLTFLWFDIPKYVFNTHLKNSLNESVFKTVNELHENENFIVETLQKSNGLKEDIKKIEESLGQQKNQYNFVGLSNGFSDLRKQKFWELIRQSIVYYALMILIVFLALYKANWSMNYLEINEINDSIFIIVTVTAVLFLFVLLYFFKISLSNIKSLKSQLLQIDLRLTLCQFIHNYNTDTIQLRTKEMQESFNKFESVIFAPIVATEDQMPGTFDGIEQMGKVIESLRK